MDRLHIVIQKLEEKVVKLRKEQNDLQQQLELASLDRELAEERARAAEAQIVQIGVNGQFVAREELEQLLALQSELEESWLRREHSLESELEKNRLAREAAESQVYELQKQIGPSVDAEMLRVQTETLRLQLSAATRELDLQKRGLAVVLRGLEVDRPEFVEYAASEDPKIGEDIARAWTSYQGGDLTLKIFKDRLAQAIQSFKVPSYPQTKLVARYLDHFSRDSINLSGASPQELRNIVNDPLNFELKSHHASDELATAKARVQALETKVARAKSLAAEVQSLEESKIQAQRLTVQLEAELHRAHGVVAAKDREISNLRDAQLPQTFQSAEIHGQILHMRAAIAFLSSQRSDNLGLKLDPLPPPHIKPPTQLAGHPTLRRIRCAVDTFHVPGNLRTAVAQYCELRRIDRLL